MKEGRVIEEHKSAYTISTGQSELKATVRGSFFDTNTFPKVGDKVLFSEGIDNKAVIDEILPRTSVIVRKTSEHGPVQTIVANVDLIFIVIGLDHDFNLNRVERYLTLARESDIRSVILLNKMDTVEDPNQFIKDVEQMSGDIEVRAVSAKKGINMGSLLEYFNEGTTVVLLGSSGAGKSTITNWLLGETRQRTGEVRKTDSKGRHTTTSRQLFSLPNGGYLIDTPGMRELGILESLGDSENPSSNQIESIAKDCKFKNCDHEKSDGCAVLEALKEDEITEKELIQYRRRFSKQ